MTMYRDSYFFAWLCPCKNKHAVEYSDRDLPDIKKEDMLDTQEICRWCGTSRSNWTFHKIRRVSGREKSDKGYSLFFHKTRVVDRWYDANTDELLLDASYIEEPSYQ